MFGYQGKKKSRFVSVERIGIAIGRSQDLHDCRINLSHIRVMVVVEFHPEGRTCVPSLKSRIPEVSLLFLHLTRVVYIFFSFFIVLFIDAILPPFLFVTRFKLPVTFCRFHPGNASLFSL